MTSTETMIYENSSEHVTAESGFYQTSSASTQTPLSNNNGSNKVIKLGVMLTDRGDWWRWQDLSAVGGAVNLAVEDFQAAGALPDYEIK